MWQSEGELLGYIKFEMIGDTSGIVKELPEYITKASETCASERRGELRRKIYDKCQRATAFRFTNR